MRRCAVPSLVCLSLYSSSMSLIASFARRVTYVAASAVTNKPNPSVKSWPFPPGKPTLDSSCWTQHRYQICPFDDYENHKVLTVSTHSWTLQNTAWWSITLFNSLLYINRTYKKTTCNDCSSKSPSTDISPRPWKHTQPASIRVENWVRKVLIWSL